ncbi:MAG: ammonia channel protein, partial [Verrucomicrobiota bacterium]|nr:ammonia channel protein [Verrucomicrobiota bacterium]
MKKLFPILTMALVIFAGSLSIETHAQETNAPAAAPAAEPPATYEGLEPSEYLQAGGDSGDTAWMIVATALVLLMTIPGLSLFYGGLARKKNVLSVLVQCFAVTALMSLLWVIYGYSFAASGDGKLFGDFSQLFLKGITTDSMSGSIPESVFVTFQMTFAIITPALIVGAFAERMKFSAVMIFLVIWFTFSYCPIWHMVWGGGYLATTWEAID